jgi:hypothetical protein
MPQKYHEIYHEYKQQQKINTQILLMFLRNFLSMYKQTIFMRCEVCKNSSTNVSQNIPLMKFLHLQHLMRGGFAEEIRIGKVKVYPCTGTEALYRS